MKKFRYNIITVGIVAAIMMLIIMLPSMLANNGIYIVRGDYIDQYIPRLIKAKEILTTGSGSWDWFNYTGAPYNKIGALFSLNTVCLLFPSQIIPYAVTYMHIIRFAIIAMASYAYLSVMLKEKKNAFLGALLYTFSGYSFLNFEFMQFMEALWTFPLLLLATERMFTTDRYKHELILVVVLSAAISFYFFVFSTISFSIYFVCRFFFSKEWKSRRTLKWLLIAVVEYVIGFLIAGCTFGVFIYQLFNTSGSSSEITASLSPGLLLYDNNFFSKIVSFFMPSVSNRFNTFGYSSWLSHGYYVPVFGVAFTVAYILKKSIKNWLSIVVILMALTIAIPGVSMVYNFMTSSYTRHAYTLTLFMVLATMTFIENYDKKKANTGVILTIGAFVLLMAVYYIASTRLGGIPIIKSILYLGTNETDIEQKFRLFRICAAVFFYIILVLYCRFDFVKKYIISFVVIGVCLYGTVYSQINMIEGYMIGSYPDTSLTPQKQAEIYYGEKPELDETEFYRIDYPIHCVNYSYTIGTPSISVFESTRSQRADEAAVQYLNSASTRVLIAPADSTNELRTLLGVKYYVDFIPQDKVEIPEGFTYARSEDGVDIYANDHYMGMGYTYNSYMLRSEFDKLAADMDNSAHIMLNTLVIEDKDEAFVSGILEKYPVTDSGEERVSLDNFRATSGGFSATMKVDRPSVVFVPVSYEDKGWFATVNGTEADIIKANIGFIAFNLDSGESHIEFIYTSPAAAVGYAMTIIGLFILVPYLLILRKTTVKSTIHQEGQD